MVEVVSLIRAGQTISTLSRTNNTVTCTLTAAYPNNNLKVGQSIKLYGNTPASFNFTGTIDTVATDKTSFTIIQAGVDEAATVVGTAGGDYTSLSAWVAGAQRDLVALNENEVCTCYDDWDTGLPDGSIAVTGFTTNNTGNDIRITVHSADRHNGKPKNGFYISYVAGSSTFGIDLTGQKDCVLEYLDIEPTNNLAGPVYKMGGRTANHCIAKGNSAINSLDGFMTGEGGTLINCISINFDRSFTQYNRTSGKWYHCLADGSSIGYEPTINSNSNDTSLLINCLEINCTTPYVSSSYYDAACATCGTSAASSALSFVTVTGLTASDFVDALNNNYNLTSTSLLKGAGTDLTGTVDLDITGATRAVPYDIGPFKYVDATGTQTIGANFIQSSETIYNLTAAEGDIYVLTNFINSEELVYGADLSQTLFIGANFIVSQEAVYDPIVQIGNQYIQPSFILTQELVYQPLIGEGNLYISPEFIVSGELIHQPEVLYGQAIINAAFISSGELIYTHGIVEGNLYITNPDFMQSNEQVFNPGIIPGNVTLYPAMIQSGEQVYQVYVNDGTGLIFIGYMSLKGVGK